MPCLLLVDHSSHSEGERDALSVVVSLYPGFTLQFIVLVSSKILCYKFISCIKLISVYLYHDGL